MKYLQLTESDISAIKEITIELMFGGIYEASQPVSIMQKKDYGIVADHAFNMRCLCSIGKIDKNDAIFLVEEGIAMYSVNKMLLLSSNKRDKLFIDIVSKSMIKIKDFCEKIISHFKFKVNFDSRIEENTSIDIRQMMKKDKRTEGLSNFFDKAIKDESLN